MGPRDGLDALINTLVRKPVRGPGVFIYFLTGDVILEAFHSLYSSGHLIALPILNRWRLLRAQVRTCHSSVACTWVEFKVVVHGWTQQHD
jgi:hypothetical protein